MELTTSQIHLQNNLSRIRKKRLRVKMKKRVADGTSDDKTSGDDRGDGTDSTSRAFGDDTGGESEWTETGISTEEDSEDEQRRQGMSEEEKQRHAALQEQIRQEKEAKATEKGNAIDQWMALMRTELESMDASAATVAHLSRQLRVPHTASSTEKKRTSSAASDNASGSTSAPAATGMATGPERARVAESGHLDQQEQLHQSGKSGKSNQEEESRVASRTPNVFLRPGLINAQAAEGLAGDKESADEQKKKEGEAAQADWTAQDTDATQEGATAGVHVSQDGEATHRTGLSEGGFAEEGPSTSILDIVEEVLELQKAEMQEDPYFESSTEEDEPFETESEEDSVDEMDDELFNFIKRAYAKRAKHLGSQKSEKEQETTQEEGEKKEEDEYKLESPGLSSLEMFRRRMMFLEEVDDVTKDEHVKILSTSEKIVEGEVEEVADEVAFSHTLL